MIGNRAILGAVVSLALLLTGCAGFTLVEAGKRIDLGEGLAVQPGRDWNRATVRSGYEYWTLDGLQLQFILFVKGIEDGELLIPDPDRSPGDDDASLAAFRKGMTLLEVRELLETALARKQAQRFTVTRFAPAAFGNKDGFRLDFAYDTKQGLNMLGTARGTVHEDRLYMVIYRGTKLHFFDRGRDDFNRIVSSLHLT